MDDQWRVQSQRGWLHVSCQILLIGITQCYRLIRLGLNETVLVSSNAVALANTKSISYMYCLVLLRNVWTLQSCIIP